MCAYRNSIKKTLRATAGILFLFFLKTAAAVTLPYDGLVSILEHPDNAAASRYNLKDSSNQAMQCVSVIDLAGQPSGWKYAAVYHTPYAVTNGGYRYKVNLAASTNLVSWTYLRTLIDNADMPKITKVENGDWLIIAHEQWMSEGSNGESSSPCQLGFKLYYSAQNLITNPAADGTWTAGKFSSDWNGTPCFYETALVLTDGYYCVNATVGFHYWSGTRDLNAYALVTRLFHPLGGTAWQPAAANGYNQCLIDSGVTGNIGQRDVIEVSSGRYNIQEGNMGIPGESWDQWRIHLYTYGDTNRWPTGNGALVQLSPQTPNGSYSFGNPGISVVTSPQGTGSAVFISYFIFSQGAGTGEAGSLAYYYNLTTNANAPVSIRPVKDTTVRSLSTVNQADMGGADRLLINKAAIRGILDFDLSTLTRPVTNAVLKLTQTANLTSGTWTLDAYPMVYTTNNYSWNEGTGSSVTGVTNTNAPASATGAACYLYRNAAGSLAWENASGSALTNCGDAALWQTTAGSVTAADSAAGRQIEITLNASAIETFRTNGAGRITLGVWGKDNMANNYYFASGEHIQTDWRPVLVLQTEAQPQLQKIRSFKTGISGGQNVSSVGIDSGESATLWFCTNLMTAVWSNVASGTGTLFYTNGNPSGFYKVTVP